jgi:superoxide reductase
MSKKNTIYKDPISGSLISIMGHIDGELTLDGNKLLELPMMSPEKEGKEKHVPILEVLDEHRVKVKVGSVPHPMEESHYITLIQLMRGDDVLAGKRLKSTDKPEAEFYVDSTEGLWAREHCNLHGLWRS